jgi:hypothetical protein
MRVIRSEWSAIVGHSASMIYPDAGAVIAQMSDAVVPFEAS